MTQSAGLTRRQMIQSTAGGAAAALLSTSTASLFAQTPARSPVRVGVIGIGRRAQEHIRICAEQSDLCRITAMCDIIRERAEEAANKFSTNIEVFGDHRDLIRADLCDAVIIATPNYTHKQIALDAINGKLHVLCEKPMTTTMADARELVDAADKSDRIFAVGLQFRYVPIYHKVRELIKAGTIGDLRYVWAEEFRGDWARLYRDPEIDAKKNWRYYRKLSGGTLVEKNCHDFDILGWVVDAEPTVVTATGGNSVYRDRETIDHASVSVEHANGAHLSLGMCLFAKVPQDNTTFVGTEATITMPRGGTYLTIHRRGSKDERVEAKDTPMDKFGHRGTDALHADFLNAIATGKQPAANVHVGCNSLRIPIAAQESIRQRKVIDMTQWNS